MIKLTTHTLFAALIKQNSPKEKSPQLWWLRAFKVP